MRVEIAPWLHATAVTVVETIPWQTPRGSGRGRKACAFRKLAAGYGLRVGRLLVLYVLHAQDEGSKPEREATSKHDKLTRDPCQDGTERRGRVPDGFDMVPAVERARRLHGAIKERLSNAMRRRTRRRGSISD